LGIKNTELQSIFKISECDLLSHLQVKPLAENRFAARLNIGEVPFGGWKQQKYEAKSDLGKNCVIDFCILKNQEFPPESDRLHRGMGRKLL